MHVKWYYRTILFEFQKDGLLGDRYIDDDEMENVLNEQGEKGWELVSVTPVQEGLLSFFKRPRQQPVRQASVPSENTVGQASKSTHVSGRQVKPKPVSGNQGSTVPSKKLGQKPNGIGGIKIS